jgi:hypothetical protein
MIIGVINLKGGVAKTMIAINLAAVIAKAGNRVLLVDADPQSSALAWSAARQADPIFPVSAIVFAIAAFGFGFFALFGLLSSARATSSQEFVPLVIPLIMLFAAAIIFGVAVLFTLTALEYWLTIQWVDEHDGWGNLVRRHGSNGSDKP